MTLSHIEAFIAVAEYGSVTAAAEKLYVTQPTLSRRLEALEQELGTQLFLRQKGRHRIQLTGQGRAFLLQAHKWRQLWRETRLSMEQAQLQKFSVIMIYSLASAFGEAIMDRFLGRGFSVALSLRSTTSLEANLHVERQEADVALVNSAYSSNTVCITPLAKEKMVLVVSKNSDYPDFVPLRELSIRDEVFLGWGNDFDVWHDFNIGAPEQAFLRADSFMHLDAPMKLWNKWTLMPFSLAQTLCARGDARTCETDLVLPDRIIYLSRPARPKQPYFDAFEEDVRAVLRASKGLALL